MQNLCLSINTSAKQFRMSDFVQHIKFILWKYQVPPHKLKLELTESVVLQNVKEVIDRMKLLREYGIQLALDDFGTGYSSLAYLKQLPFNQLKIDQSFVHDITHNTSDTAMVRAIINMAKTFGLEVIAEGVETQEQLSILQELGCYQYQGNYFSPPVLAGELEALMAKVN